MTEPAPGLSEGPSHALQQGAFLLIDKPRGPSSHQVTAWVREMLHLKVAGHAGTLDPNVSGLLWIGVGPALKLLPLVLEFPKRYIGVVEMQGEVSTAAFARAVEEFIGPVYQTPPVRSAVKRQRRIRTIHRIDLLDAEGTRRVLDVVCDSGTYMRTLAVDLGDALGVGGHLAELRRTGTGPFGEAGAATLAALADAVAKDAEGDPGPLLALLHPIEEVVREFPSITVKDVAASAIAHGADLAPGGIAQLGRPFAEGARVILRSRSGELLAYGIALKPSTEVRTKAPGWTIDCQRVFVDPRKYPKSWGTPATPPASATPSPEG
jgi:H/ACA ribonucleoprotein complex subunit 4